jgi:hypothetical protein
MSFDRSDDWIISIHLPPIAEEAAFSPVQQNAALRQSNRYLEISAPPRLKYGAPQAHGRTLSLNRRAIVECDVSNAPQVWRLCYSGSKVPGLVAREYCADQSPVGLSLK